MKIGQRRPFRAMDLLVNARPDTIRILIADQQAEFCASLRTLFNSEHGFTVVGEASDAASVVELICQAEPDILLLDSALFQSLQIGEPDVAVSPIAIRTLVMVGSPNRGPIVEAFRLGAKGVVLKSSAPRVLLMSIQAVFAGEYWLGSESAAVVVQVLREFLLEATVASPSKNFGLTPRELEIVKRIAHGRSNKEVGLEFSICERTVKHHLTNIFGKLGVSSRLKLAVFARENHILHSSAKSSDLSPRSRYRETYNSGLEP